MVVQKNNSSIFDIIMILQSPRKGTTFAFPRATSLWSVEEGRALTGTETAGRGLGCRRASIGHDGQELQG